MSSNEFPMLLPVDLYSSPVLKEIVFTLRRLIALEFYNFLEIGGYIEKLKLPIQIENLFPSRIKTIHPQYEPIYQMMNFLTSLGLFVKEASTFRLSEKMDYIVTEFKNKKESVKESMMLYKPFLDFVEQTLPRFESVCLKVDEPLPHSKLFPLLDSMLGSETFIAIHNKAVTELIDILGTWRAPGTYSVLEIGPASEYFAAQLPYDASIRDVVYLSEQYFSPLESFCSLFDPEINSYPLSALIDQESDLEGKYDIIIAPFALHFNLPASEWLSILAKSLKINGVLVFMYTSEEKLGLGIEPLYSVIQDYKNHLPEKDLERFLPRKGFGPLTRFGPEDLFLYTRKIKEAN
ncbi:MAG: hypothetical protein ACTSYA_09465 [Candidatus Kariarchaeaceae archaeon]